MFVFVLCRCPVAFRLRISYHINVIHAHAHAMSKALPLNVSQAGAYAELLHPIARGALCCLAADQMFASLAERQARVACAIACKNMRSEL